MVRRIVSIISTVILTFGSLLLNPMMAAADMSVGTVTPISVTASGSYGNGSSSEPFMTPDARYITFDSYATGLTGDNAPAPQSYLYDRQQHTMEIVSRTASGAFPAQGAFPQAISDDGRYVLLTSSSPDMPGYATNPAILGAVSFLYMRDRQTGTTTRIGDPSLLNVNAAAHPMSADGNVVAYTGMTYYNSPYDVGFANYIYIRSTNTTITMPSGISDLAISTDGQYATYDTPSDLGGTYTNHVYLYNIATGETADIIDNIYGIALAPDDRHFVAYAPNASGKTDVFYGGTAASDPRITLFTNSSGYGLGGISFDRLGSRVSYYTYVPGNSLTAGQVWVTDLTTGQSIMVDSGLNHRPFSQLSGDGTELAFNSMTRSGLGNNVYQVFTAQLSPAADTTAPTVTGQPDRQPNANQWYNNDVTVTWNATDPDSTATTPDPTTVSTEGANQTITSGQSCDPAGNCATGSVSLNIDKTAPTVGDATWSANPVAVGSIATFTMPATDALSGVTGGEYFIGTDPGVGQATPTSFDGTNLSATVGSNLGVGVYTIGVRAQDAAGNWSPTATTMLVIYDPTTTLRMTGKNKKDLVPSLANGDILPGLISGTQTDAADYGLTVQYKNGVLDPKNDFQFTYTTGTHCNKPTAQNCHSFSLNASSFAWLVIDGTNSSQGRFQGTATVTVDGITTTNPFTVQGTDGDLLNPATDDYLLLKVYAPGANPSNASPLYQASGFMAKGNSVKIR